MKFKPLSREIVRAIIRCNGGNGWKNDPDVWGRIVIEHEQGRKLVLVATNEGEVCGYGTLLWQSAYSPFSSTGVPEIHDLVTAQGYRRRGIAKKLISEFERIAANADCGCIGLGVGVYADYGPAQRLYSSLGYIPDGRGATYKYQPVVPGSSVCADDDLVLWLTKVISPITGAR